MKTYKITITEILTAKVEIEADSREEAIKKLEADYWKNPADYMPLLEPENTTFE